MDDHGTTDCTFPTCAPNVPQPDNTATAPPECGNNTTSATNNVETQQRRHQAELGVLYGACVSELQHQAAKHEAQLQDERNKSQAERGAAACELQQLYGAIEVAISGYTAEKSSQQAVIETLRANCAALQQEILVCAHTPKVCHGLESEYVQPILGLGTGSYYGNLSIEYLFRAMELQCAETGEQLPWRSVQDFEYAQPKAHGELKQMFQGIPLYKAHEHSLQSVLCLRESHSGTCCMCSALRWVRSVQKRVLYFAANEDKATHPSKYARHDRVSSAALVLRLREGSGKVLHLFRTSAQATRGLAAANRRADKMVLKMKSAVTKDNAPKYMRHFIEAAELDVLPPEVVQELLSDIGKGLLSTRLRRNQTSKSLYVTLMNNGSPWIASLVAQNLGGPHIRTIKRIERPRS